MSWIMTGVSAELLAVLGASLGAVVSLLYALKVRRRRVAVPYAPLWRRALGAHRPSQLWDRLKWLASLLVHLLILALILLALGDPRSERAARERRSVVLLLDTSGSMTALDEEGHRTRFARAKELVAESIRALGPRDEAVLVTMDGQLRPRTPFVSDPGALEAALADVAPAATVAHLGDAVRYAVDALEGRPNGTVVVVSDGAFPQDELDAATDALPAHVDLVFRRVGREAGNVGVTAFNVRRYPSNRTSYEVYVELRNDAGVPVNAELSIHGGGRLAFTQEVALDAHDTEVLLLADLPAAGREMEARVRVVSGDVIDRFALDDVAYALLPDRRAVQILLVTEGNLYLEGPFLLNESLEVETITPGEYGAAGGGDASADFDVTVFDGVAPPTSGVGNYLYFAPAGEASPWRVTGEVEAPIITTSERGHPLLRWITGLRDLNVATARRLALTEDDRAIASAIGGAPMIVTRETAQSRLIAIAFDIAATDLPLRVAYPVLMLNAIDWFTRDSDALVEAYRTGETWFVPVPEHEGTASITAPSGRSSTSPIQDGRVGFYGAEVGFHSVRVGGHEVRVAANLASSSESRIEPVATPAALGASDALDDASLDLAVDPWLALVAIAIALLLVEWATWNRRVTV